MQKIDVDGFIDFIDNLKIGTPSEVYAKSLNGESDESYLFLKIEFSGDTIVLYETYCGDIGTIKDTALGASWEDCAEDVYEALTHEGEYDMFIK